LKGRVAAKMDEEKVQPSAFTSACRRRRLTAIVLKKGGNIEKPTKSGTKEMFGGGKGVYVLRNSRSVSKMGLHYQEGGCVRTFLVWREELQAK